MSKQKKIEITPKKLKEIQKDAVYRTVVIMSACLMDEFDFTGEQLTAFADRFERYSSATEQHLITIKQVKDIMNDVMFGDD